jgi:hypothetical protein
MKTEHIIIVLEVKFVLLIKLMKHLFWFTHIPN